MARAPDVMVGTLTWHRSRQVRCCLGNSTVATVDFDRTGRNDGGHGSLLTSWSLFAGISREGQPVSSTALNSDGSLAPPMPPPHSIQPLRPAPSLSFDQHGQTDQPVGGLDWLQVSPRDGHFVGGLLRRLVPGYLDRGVGNITGCFAVRLPPVQLGSGQGQCDADFAPGALLRLVRRCRLRIGCRRPARCLPRPPAAHGRRR